MRAEHMWTTPGWTRRRKTSSQPPRHLLLALARRPLRVSHLPGSLRGLVVKSVHPSWPRDRLKHRRRPLPRRRMSVLMQPILSRTRTCQYPRTRRGCSKRLPKRVRPVRLRWTTRAVRMWTTRTSTQRRRARASTSCRRLLLLQLLRLVPPSYQALPGQTPCQVESPSHQVAAMAARLSRTKLLST